MTQDTLTVRGLLVRYGSVVALDSIDFSIRAGEVVGIMGPNGSGKSTLLSCIAGFVKPSAGSIHLLDTPLDALTPSRRARLGLRLVNGSIPVFGEISVANNLRLGAWSTHRGRRAFKRATKALLKGFPNLQPKLWMDAAKLSEGEKRQLAVACALYAAPRAILADELTVGLDARAADLVGETLRSVAENGTAVALVEHDETFVERFCTRRIRMQAGSIVANESLRPDVADESLGSGVADECSRRRQRIFRSDND